MKKTILLSMIFVLFISFSLFAEEYSFCSSKTSNVFHNLYCGYASNFTQENADYYMTYENAIEDGLRECRVCRPEPQEIQEPDEPDLPDWVEDPNLIWIEPSPTPAILFPINGVVIQSEYCVKQFNPQTDIGGTILRTDHYEVTYEEIKNKYKNCPLCADHINNITDPNYLVLIAENDKTNFHTNEDCLAYKEVPVRMVNLRSGMVSGNDAYFHPAMGVLEWKITPFEIGDYTAVMNSDVGQMQLLSLTVKQTRIPDIEEFVGSWLSGNFNLYKYKDWTQQRILHQERTSNAKDSTGSIEWVFQDGQWIPTTSGHVPKSEIFKMNITERTTYERKTIEEEVKVAPYEWKTKSLQLTEITTTNYDGINEWTFEKELASKLGYLNSPTFAKQNAVVLASGYRDRIFSDDERVLSSGEPEEYLLMIGVRPEPEKVKEPKIEDFYNIIGEITNSEINSEMRYKELISMILLSYETQKESHEKYVEELEQWEREKQEAIQEHDIERFGMMDHEGRRHLYDYDYDYDYEDVPMSILRNENVVWYFENGHWRYRIEEPTED